MSICPCSISTVFLAKELRLNLSLALSWLITCLQSLVTFLFLLEELVVIHNLSVTPGGLDTFTVHLVLLIDKQKILVALESVQAGCTVPFVMVLRYFN